MINAIDLESVLWNSGITCTPILPARNYSLPTADWVFGEFARAYRVYLAALDVQNYKPDANDCFGFTFNAYTLARNLHARTPGAPETGLAFGASIFIQDDGRIHAFNPFVTKEGDVHVVHFFEPQTQAEARPSRKEISQITFCLL